MSRFEHAFRLAIGAQPVAVASLRTLHATLAACRLADRIEQRFEGNPPPGVHRNQVQQAADEWRCWTGETSIEADNLAA